MYLVGNANNRNELTLNEEIERVIRKDADLECRLKAFRELTELLERDQLEDVSLFIIISPFTIKNQFVWIAR